MKNLLKTLSRLDSILLATTVIAASAAGYGAYSSYSSIQQVQELSAKVSSLESASSDNFVLIQSMEEERDTYRQQLKTTRLEKAAMSASLQDQKNNNIGYQQQIEKLQGSYSHILSKDEAIAALDSLFNSSSSTASSSTSTPVYYAQTPSAPSIDNTDRIFYLKSQLSYVDSQISLCKANYNAAVADAQNTYNSYSEQARQSYVDYMMQKKNSGDTATEQLRLDTAQANQRALGQQASDAEAVIDDLNKTYEDAIDALEDYRDEILDELDKLQ